MPRRSSWGNHLNKLLLGCGAAAAVVFFATYYPVVGTMLRGQVATTLPLEKCNAQLSGIFTQKGNDIYIEPVIGRQLHFSYRLVYGIKNSAVNPEKDDCPVTVTIPDPTGANNYDYKVNRNQKTAPLGPFEWKDVATGLSRLSGNQPLPIVDSALRVEVPVPDKSKAPPYDVSLVLTVLVNTPSTKVISVNLHGATYRVHVGVPPANPPANTVTCGLQIPGWDDQAGEFVIDPTVSAYQIITVTGGQDCALYIAGYKTDSAAPGGFASDPARVLFATDDFWTATAPVAGPFNPLNGSGVGQNGVGFNVIPFNPGRINVGLNSPPPPDGDDGGKRVIHVYERKMVGGVPQLSHVKAYPYRILATPPPDSPCPLIGMPTTIIRGAPAVTVQIQDNDESCFVHALGTPAAGGQEEMFSINGNTAIWRNPPSALQAAVKTTNKLLRASGGGSVRIEATGQGTFTISADADAALEKHEGNRALKVVQLGHTLETHAFEIIDANSPPCALEGGPIKIKRGAPAADAWTFLLNGSDKCSITTVGQGASAYYSLNKNDNGWKADDGQLLPIITHLFVQPQGVGGNVSFEFVNINGKVGFKAYADADVPLGVYGEENTPDSWRVLNLWKKNKFGALDLVGKFTYEIVDDLPPQPPPNAPGCVLNNMPDKIVRGVQANAAPVVSLQGADCVVYIWGTEHPAGNQDYDYHYLSTNPLTGKWIQKTDPNVASDKITYGGKLHFEIVDATVPSFRIYADADTPLNLSVDGRIVALTKKIAGQLQLPLIKETTLDIVAADASVDPPGGTFVNVPCNPELPLAAAVTGTPSITPCLDSGEECVLDTQCISGLCQDGICKDLCVYDYGRPTNDPATNRTLQYVDKADWDRGVWQDCYSTFSKEIGEMVEDPNDPDTEMIFEGSGVYEVKDFQCGPIKTCAIVKGYPGDPRCAVCTSLANTAKPTGSNTTSTGGPVSSPNTSGGGPVAASTPSPGNTGGATAPAPAPNNNNGGPVVAPNNNGGAAAPAPGPNAPGNNGGNGGNGPNTPTTPGNNEAPNVPGTTPTVVTNATNPGVPPPTANTPVSFCGGTVNIACMGVQNSCALDFGNGPQFVTGYAVAGEESGEVEMCESSVGQGTAGMFWHELTHAKQIIQGFTGDCCSKEGAAYGAQWNFQAYSPETSAEFAGIAAEAGMSVPQFIQALTLWGQNKVSCAAYGPSFCGDDSWIRADFDAFYLKAGLLGSESCQDIVSTNNAAAFQQMLTDICAGSPPTPSTSSTGATSSPKSTTPVTGGGMPKPNVCNLTVLGTAAKGGAKLSELLKKCAEDEKTKCKGLFTSTCKNDQPVSLGGGQFEHTGACIYSCQ